MKEPSGMQSVRARYVLATREFQKELRAYLYRIVRNIWDTDELLQEVFIRLLTVGDVEEGVVDNLRALAFTTARNLALDCLRRRGPVSRDVVAAVEAMGVPTEGADIVSLLDAHQDLERLERALQRLSPRGRMVFLLTKVEGYKASEVAERLGISEKTVRNHLATAMSRCAEILFVRGADPESMLFRWFHRLGRRRKRGGVR